MGTKHEIEVIPFESKIKLEITGSFYARLQQLTIHYTSKSTKEEILEAMKRMSDKEQAKTEFEYHIQTLTSLMYEIEMAAKEQNLLEKREIEVPDPEANQDPT
jgi:hypothetical protein